MLHSGYEGMLSHLITYMYIAADDNKVTFNLKP